MHGAHRRKRHCTGIKQALSFIYQLFNYLESTHGEIINPTVVSVMFGLWLTLRLSLRLKRVHLTAAVNCHAGPTLGRMNLYHTKLREP
jgi:hypothetical protein